ncbi:MAG: HAMP domain-containing sensor histidine kinase [Pseudomonadota bacterium]
MMSRAEPSHSLALRLGALAAAGSFVALAIAGLVMAALHRAGAERAFDDRLADFVSQLFADFANERLIDATAHFANPAFGRPGSGWFWAVADPISGEARLASASLFDPLPSPSPEDHAANNAGRLQTATVITAGDRLRLAERLYQLDGEPVLIRVTAPTEGLDREIAAFRLALFLTLSIMWLVLLALAYLQVRIGLQPLATVRQAVSDVREARASRVQGRFPTEVSPLVDELNAMIETNSEVMQRARHHVGNLAHALKTPLAVILNATSAPASEIDATQTKIHAVARDIDSRIRIYLDRAQRSAIQSVAGQATHILEVAEPLVRTVQKLSRDKSLDFAIDIQPQDRVRVERHDFEEILGNLLENASRHAHGQIRLSNDQSSDDQSMTIISIDDDGDGLSEHDRALVLKRGQRLDEASKGSGLGLAIVQEIAELYGGGLALSQSPLGGLRASLTLPSAAPVPPDSQRNPHRRDSHR